MNQKYLGCRLGFLLTSYPKKWIRLFNWPFTGSLKLLLSNSPNQRNLLRQIGAWWLALLFLLLDLLLLGDVYELLASRFKKTRPLSAHEVRIAEQIFGNSIRYELIRLDEHAYLMCKSKGIAYVSLFTINSWGGVCEHTLIHELVHVWQYQKLGLAYIPLALMAQISREGYSYNGPEGLKSARSAGCRLDAFNLEQQAEIIADCHSSAQKASLADREPTAEKHVSDLEYFASQLHLI